MDKITLVDMKLHKNKLANGVYSYYLSAEYNRENEFGIFRITVPHVDLPLSNGFSWSTSTDPFDVDLIDFGFGELPFRARNGGIIETKIKDKTKKMTLAEIEKKLGHKIELVSE